MTTYVYQTIPAQPGEKPEYFEIKQNMTDPALTTHPETGVAIRRVILGGFGILSSGKAASQQASVGSTGRCGSGCGCH